MIYIRVSPEAIADKIRELRMASAAVSGAMLCNSDYWAVHSDTLTLIRSQVDYLRVLYEDLTGLIHI